MGYFGVSPEKLRFSALAPFGTSISAESNSMLAFGPIVRFGGVIVQP
jgi:hypothetical protein